MFLHVRCPDHRRRGQQPPPHLLSGDVRALERQPHLSPSQHEAQGHRPRQCEGESPSQYVLSLCIKDISIYSTCFPIFPTLRMENSMLTCSCCCRRSHHSLNQNISCGGWGDEQTKRTCEIFDPMDGWHKEDFLLGRKTVEHVGWRMRLKNVSTGRPTGIPRIVLMSGNDTEVVTPKGSFETE